MSSKLDELHLATHGWPGNPRLNSGSNSSWNDLFLLFLQKKLNQSRLRQIKLMGDVDFERELRSSRSVRLHTTVEEDSDEILREIWKYGERSLASSGSRARWGYPAEEDSQNPCSTIFSPFSPLSYERVGGTKSRCNSEMSNLWKIRHLTNGEPRCRSRHAEPAWSEGEENHDERKKSPIEQKSAALNSVPSDDENSRAEATSAQRTCATEQEGSSHKTRPIAARSRQTSSKSQVWWKRGSAKSEQEPTLLVLHKRDVERRDFKSAIDDFVQKIEPLKASEYDISDYYVSRMMHENAGHSQKHRSYRVNLRSADIDDSRVRRCAKVRALTLKKLDCNFTDNFVSI